MTRSMLRRMTSPQPYQNRWRKERTVGGNRLILQQYIPTGSDVLPPHLKSGEWVDVPIMSTDEDSTRRIVKAPSGPMDIPTAKTTAFSALEPRAGQQVNPESPEELEREIEKTYGILVALMSQRSLMSSFPPYDGTAILVHGGEKQRLLVNGFERTMPPQALLIASDDDLHRLQSHTVPRKA